MSNATFDFDSAPMEAYSKTIADASAGEVQLATTPFHPEEIPQRFAGPTRALIALNSATMNLAALGVITGDNSKWMGALNGAVMADMLAMGVYNIYRGILMAQAAKEEALAMGETTVHAIAQDWEGIAFAVAAFGVVTGSAIVGESMASSGDWAFGHAEIGTPAGRRRIESDMRRVR